MTTTRANQWRINVSGLNELRRGLKKLDAGLPKELREVNRAAATVVAVEARARVPVRGGGLRSTIRPLAAGARARVVAGNSSVVYAPIIEFGWPRHNIEPQGYLYPALAAKSEAVVETYGRSISDLLNRIPLPS